MFKLRLSNYHSLNYQQLLTKNLQRTHVWFEVVFLSVSLKNHLSFTTNDLSEDYFRYKLMVIEHRTTQSLVSQSTIRPPPHNYHGPIPSIFYRRRRRRRRRLRFVNRIAPSLSPHACHIFCQLKVRPVWPDWAIFEIVLATNFIRKVAQILGDFLGSFDEHTF